ncbi:MAG: PIN domain-containing protein [Chloroflexi bacterium]|nr:PIN domain-containing protein [Chloroflexota bacterium]
MIRILVDASALVPLEVGRDQWRARVLAILRELTKAGRFELVTTSWTLYEALAIVQRRDRSRVAHLFARASNLMHVVRVGPAAEAEALRRFLTWADKTASIVDHANLLVALETGCDAVISFDDDFRPLVAGTALRLVR